MTVTYPIQILNEDQCNVDDPAKQLDAKCQGLSFKQHVDVGCPFSTIGCFKRGCPCSHLTMTQMTQEERLTVQVATFCRRYPKIAMVYK